MTIRDIYKLFWHDNIYTLELVECSNGECNSVYQDDSFMPEDWEKEVLYLDIRDLTENEDNPNIVIYCYTKGD